MVWVRAHSEQQIRDAYMSISIISIEKINPPRIAKIDDDLTDFDGDRG